MARGRKGAPLKKSPGHFTKGVRTKKAFGRSARRGTSFIKPK